MKNNLSESLAKVCFGVAAGVSVLAVALICIFLFASGVPAIGQIGLGDFLLGTEWRPANLIFGIFPMIVGSVCVTLGALVLGVPVGLFCAIFLSKFASKRAVKMLMPGVQLLAGIPSVVYGFFGLVVIVPWLRGVFHVQGMSILAASIVLGIMILPTIITTAKNSIDAVPESYYEGSLALGADHERSVFRIMVPAALSGIMSGIVLGLGRAIGETMAVVMVAGNQVQLPSSIMDGVRTLTTNIVLEMGYAADLHRDALIATAVVLFVFILLINLVFSIVKARSSKHA